MIPEIGIPQLLGFCMMTSQIATSWLLTYKINIAMSFLPRNPHTRLTEQLAFDDISYPSHGSIQQLIDHATTAKNIHGTKGVISPYAWVIGAHKHHPLIDSEFVPPVTNASDTSDPFVLHFNAKCQSC